MTKVITYGTYDLLHRGHVRLLERAKALGDYLIVGVTADDFDKTRGKINVQQSLMERIEGVKSLGIADEIIVEEYEGQKIDDITRLGVDIFTVGSDWIGKFDYLNEYCKVVYLERTEGVSSSEIREERRALRLGIIGESGVALKYARESRFVNGLAVSGICSENIALAEQARKEGFDMCKTFDELTGSSDAIYVVSHPKQHEVHIRMALSKGRHVLCESPIGLSAGVCRELFSMAKERDLVLMDSIKTAYSTAYRRLLLLVKSGVIGEVFAVDATCTSLTNESDLLTPWGWNSSCAWGPTALLPVFQILGTDYREVRKRSFGPSDQPGIDSFSKFDFEYPKAVATAKVGKGVKSEGELVISGTRGYIYVPAPWWKTDYFEIRYENPMCNRRHFYQLDGEGIRYELLAFAKAIKSRNMRNLLPSVISEAICANMPVVVR